MWMRWRLAVGLSVGSAASLPAQQLTRVEERALADTLVRFGREMVAAVRARNIERTLSFYGRPREFVQIENGVRVGWPELERRMREFMGAVKENRLEWIGDPSVLILGRDAAVLVGRHAFSGIDAQGRPIPAHCGEWTGVLQRIDGAWRVVHSHSSDAAPNASSAPRPSASDTAPPPARRSPPRTAPGCPTDARSRPDPRP